MSRVLVVDDEPDLLELVRYNLEKEGFRVDTARDAEEGLAALRRATPAAIVLDLMLPGSSGLEVLKRLRASPQTSGIPVIILTAKGAEADRVVGLELGADDYVVKPFSPRELVARVRAVLRRSKRAADSAPPVVRAGPLEIDTEKRTVTAAGAAAPLTTTEFDLLLCLARRPGRAFKRGELIAEALGEDAVVTERVIDAHVAAVRRKLGEEAGAWIETLRGFGYRFREA
jgi:two-component system phosphate regulon response regulator PhoB